jgi:lipopolysaccharide/colanic/teichoic acid biosynthesis glycosyltransferase
VKVAADRVIALVLIVLAAPLIALLAALVRAGSRGPAIYRQVRLGRGGRPFSMYKIRTMAHDCERATGPTWSIPGDPRVTRLGRFLRRTHLDELPQLWNVLRGEMSLVGPRPERPEIIGQLERVLPRYRDRLAVLPGVTGLAQVQLPPDTEVSGVRVKLDYDFCYIARMAPGLDARLIVATALKVIGVPPAATLRLLALPTPGGEGQSRVREPSAPVLGARTA